MMPDPIRISILTPIFNGVEFLEHCALSVMLQVTQIGEIRIEWDWWIGVNGHGRTGGQVAAEVEKLRGMAGGGLYHRIHLRVFEAASKVATLNALAAEAGGDWIAILDVDDTWDRAKLLVQAAASLQDAPGAAVIGTFCHYFGAINSGGPDLPSGWIPLELLPTLNPLINSSVLIRRRLAYWSDQFPGLDDYDLWYRLAGAGHRFYNVPLRLVHHRIHPKSAFNASGVQDVAGLRAWHAAAGTLTRVTK